MKFLPIGDIMTEDMYFYDPGMRDICIKFCLERSISYLPGLGNDSQFFRIDGDKASPYLLEEGQMINVSMDAFGPEFMEKFEKYSVLFVFNVNRLAGVIHFSDYDRKPAMLYLYSLIMEIEKNLRLILRNAGFSNVDIYNFFADHASENEHYKKQKEKYEKNKGSYAMRESFQEFYLLDLIAFSRKKKIVEIDSERVNQIRNSIAHSKRVVDHECYGMAEHIYSLESFKRFFEAVIACQTIHRKLKNTILLKEICAA